LGDGSIDNHSSIIRYWISIWSTRTLKRIKLKGGAEEDALTPARKWYKYLTKPGVVKAIKKSYNKRFRQEAKAFDKSQIEYRDGDNT
jgi:hypothetical protein